MADDMKIKGLEPGCSYCGAFCPRCTSRRPVVGKKLQSRLEKDANRRWRREAASSGRQCEVAAQWVNFCRRLGHLTMNAHHFANLMDAHRAGKYEPSPRHYSDLATYSLHGWWSAMARAIVQGGWEPGDEYPRRDGFSYPHMSRRAREGIAMLAPSLAREPGRLDLTKSWPDFGQFEKGGA